LQAKSAVLLAGLIGWISCANKLDLVIKLV
jgi:hypothetical protein